ncbi:MlaD family protein [Campylobacter sp. JMF_04 NA10]|uniref:MlaD family protein n=1 Tax=Campylobacter sp. JMF_04 NA10 TaxID=2983824 RepID=UPI0022E9A0E1|nr:MlaD family protein [Campylobacter sp. JMF_04 NA10]MDA3076430.1 MlaD family protein [Campylobacter sp. JMF_04 NA10]
MENRTSYTIVGAFVMACVFALTAFVWWMLTRTDTRETYRSYYIHTKELPTGIRENSDVKFIGVNAGIIKKIDFVDIENAIIEIEVSLKSKLPISRDSIAKVETQGISGISFLNITKGSGDLFSENEEKPIIELDKTLLDKIGSKAEVITDSVGQMIFKINSLLSQDNMKKVDEILTSLNKFSAELSDEKKFNELNALMANFNTLMTNLNEREHELDEILDKFNAFASSATRLSNSLEKTSQIMAKRVERGEYNLKAILDPTLNEAKTTLTEFNKALREFQGAMFRLEENPYEFFFRDTKKD